MAEKSAASGPSKFGRILKSLFLGCGTMVLLAVLTTGAIMIWMAWPYPDYPARDFLSTGQTALFQLHLDPGNNTVMDTLQEKFLVLSREKHKKMPDPLRSLLVERDLSKFQRIRALPAFNAYMVCHASRVEDIERFAVIVHLPFGKLWQLFYSAAAALIPSEMLSGYRGVPILRFKNKRARNAAFRLESSGDEDFVDNFGLTVYRGYVMFGTLDPSGYRLLDTLIDQGRGDPADSFLSRNWPSDTNESLAVIDNKEDSLRRMFLTLCPCPGQGESSEEPEIEWKAFEGAVLKPDISSIDKMEMNVILFPLHPIEAGTIQSWVDYLAERLSSSTDFCVRADKVRLENGKWMIKFYVEGLEEFLKTFSNPESGTSPGGVTVPPDKGFSHPSSGGCVKPDSDDDSCSSPVGGFCPPSG